MAKKYVLANGADFYAQNGSTEFKVITSTGDVIAGRVMYGNSSDNVIVNSSGEILYRGYDMRAVQTLTSGSDSTDTAITGYGITVFHGDTGCSLSMSAPVYAGVRKQIIFTQGSSVARSINSSETTGSTDNDLGFSFWSTAATNSSAITLSTGSTLACTINLLGISTQQWLLLHEDSTLSNVTIATT
ncbi:MAG: hypothetical protein JRI72_00100 [Deltaproteobacteria bacterium]|nr:hypothetical protein [Deltaproteobacteria bacterium]